MPHKRGGNIKTEEEEEKRSYYSKYDSSKIMFLSNYQKNLIDGPGTHFLKLLCIYCNLLDVFCFVVFIAKLGSSSVPVRVKFN